MTPSTVRRSALATATLTLMAACSASPEPDPGAAEPSSTRTEQLARVLDTQRTPTIPESPQPRNGKWVVFSALHLDPDPGAPSWSRGRDASLFVGGPDGSARLLVENERRAGSTSCPAFSPDGSMLAYGRTGGRQNTVVVTGFSPDGDLRAPRIVIPVPSSASFIGSCPVWAPDGRRLATVAPGRGVLIADPRGPTRLVELEVYGLVEGGVDLEWSPDGSQLAILVSSSPSEQELWLVVRQGGVARRLSEFASDPGGGAMAWTEDGRSLVVAGGECCGKRPPYVQLVDVSTGSGRELQLPAAWDGSTIMQILSIGDDRFVVMRADLEGWSPPEMLDLKGRVSSLGHLRYQPTSFISVSPDRTDLLYVTYDPSQPARGQAVVAVPLDGGEPTRYSPSTPQGFGDNYSTFAWQPS
jgi:Tol biopolymer transport system component